jgi:hypothetical protein
VGAAESIPIGSDTCDMLVSSLGDPYNTDDFWAEAYRVLRIGARCIFTTPSYDWAADFRRIGQLDGLTFAEFELADGRRLLVRSLIYPVDSQCEGIRRSGLVVTGVRHVRLSELRGTPISPKLLLGRRSDIPVVTAFEIRKES